MKRVKLAVNGTLMRGLKLNDNLTLNTGTLSYEDMKNVEEPDIFGSPGAIHRYFRDWERRGFFRELWERGLSEYDEMEGIAWKWQSIGGSNHSLEKNWSYIWIIP